MVRTHSTLYPLFLYPKKLYINLVEFCPVELPALVRTMTSDYVSWVLGLQGWDVGASYKRGLVYGRRSYSHNARAGIPKAPDSYIRA